MKSLRKIWPVLIQTKGDLSKITVSFFAILTRFIVNCILDQCTLMIRKLMLCWAFLGLSLWNYKSWELISKDGTVNIIMCWFLRRIKVTCLLSMALLRLNNHFLGKMCLVLSVYKKCSLDISSRHSNKDPHSLPPNSETSHCSRLSRASQLASYCTGIWWMESYFYSTA